MSAHLPSSAEGLSAARERAMASKHFDAEDNVNDIERLARMTNAFAEKVNTTLQSRAGYQTSYAEVWSEMRREFDTLFTAIDNLQDIAVAMHEAYYADDVQDEDVQVAA